MEFAVPLNKKQPEPALTPVSVDTERTIRYIDSEEDRNNVIKDNKIVVIKYSAHWCKPCKRIAPAYLEMCQTDPEVVYCEEDIDEEFEGYHEKILSIPTFHVFANGQFVGSSKGTSLDELKKIINTQK